MKYFFIVVSIFGWGVNFYTLSHMDSVISGLGAVRIIGAILYPIGAFLGFCDILTMYQ